MRTADGYLMIGAAGEPIWVRCAEALGHKQWCEAPLSTTRLPKRGAHEATLKAVPMTDTTEHWVEVLEAAGVPCAPVYNYQQMFADRMSVAAAFSNAPPTPNRATSRTSTSRSRSTAASECVRSPRSSASTTPGSW